MIKNIVNIFLFIAAVLLSPLLYIGFFYQIITKFGYTSRYLGNVAFIIDIFGNVVCGQLFNDTLRKEGGYRFGYYKDTISYVLGRNHAYGTLTNAGKVVRLILNSIDKDHCEKAYMNKR